MEVGKCPVDVHLAVLSALCRVTSILLIVLSRTRLQAAATGAEEGMKDDCRKLKVRKPASFSVRPVLV